MSAATTASTELATITDRLAPVVDGLDASYAASVRAMFEPMFVNLEKWERQARTIVVTREDQTADVKMAHALRMDIRKSRVNADKARKGAKANILLQSRAIDGAYNIYAAAVEPIESYLLEQESFAERQATARRDKLRDARTEAICALGVDPATLADLGAMGDEAWGATIESAKLAREAKAEAVRQEEAIRAEAERLAAEAREKARLEAIQREAARVERERVQAEENARLKVEAAEREEAVRVEREVVAKEKAKLEAEAKAARDAAAAEKAALEVRARAERDAAEAATRKAKEAADAVAAELAATKAAAAKAARDREEAETARVAAEKTAADARAKQETARLAAEEEARQTALLAPDREKLAAFARTLRSLAIPTLTTERGKAAGAKVTEQIAKMIGWIERTGSAL